MTTRRTKMPFTNKNAADYFDEWMNTIGVRTYSKNHGSAEGHREYMAAAYLSGFRQAEALYGRLNDETETHKD
jgi:hypothetical protein